MTIQFRLNKLLLKLMPKSQYLYKMCSSYVDHYLNQNNINMEQNGELNLIKQILPTSKVVFDAGANIGRWTKLALQINPNLAIHSFEPSPIVFKQLSNQNWPQNVRLNNLGFSHLETNGTLYHVSANSGSNSLYPRQGLPLNRKTSFETETIRLITLDGYCQDKKINDIDFLKVDVEGHELNVFEGGKQLFTAQKVRYIQFEYGGCHIDARVFLKDFFDFFQPLGYRLGKINSDSVHFYDTYQQSLETFQYQNWLATVDHNVQ